MAGFGYPDMPVHPLRFALFYGALSGAIWALVAGLLALIGTRLLSESHRALGIAFGAGSAALVLLAARLHLTLHVVNEGMSSSARWGWSSLPGLAGIGAVLGAAALLGVAAYLLARSRLRRVRLAGTAAPLCAALALALRAGSGPDRDPAAAPGTVVDTGSESPLDYRTTNLLLITIDTLRADHLGSHGYPRDTAPQLDRLAARGVRFERALTQRTCTAPALATLLTGTYPPTHKVLNNRQTLQEFNLTLAELLAAKGYRTRALISNPILTSQFSFHQGFDDYQHTEDLYDIIGGELRESRELNQLVLPALESLSERRFFMWVHYRDPHTPYLVPESYKDLFTSDQLADAHDHRTIPIDASAPFGAMTANEAVYESQDLDFLVAQYDAEIRHNDDSLGALFAKMDELELWDNTLVVITADHGESLWEHDLIFDHGYNAYEPSAHVPLIFYHPRLRSGLSIPTPVSLVDVLPTVLDLLRLPQPPQGQGESFASLVLGQEEAHFRPYHFVIGSYRQGYQTHAITTDRHKLILDADARWLVLDATVGLVGRLWVAPEDYNIYRWRHLVPELYDLVEDPGELTNLSGRMPALELELSNRLWRWIETTYRRGRDWESSSPELSEETAEALRALGYL